MGWQDAPVVSASWQDAPIVDAPQTGSVWDGISPARADMDGEPTPQVDRFGDTIADATEGPREAFSAFSQGLFDQSQSPTMQAMPEDWNPMLKSLYARFGDAGMTALSALGVGYAGGAGLIGETFGGSPTQERKLAGDLMMAGEVAAPELAGVGGTIRATGRAANAAQNVSEVTPRQSAARAADDLGITPSLGMQGKTAAVVSSAAEKTPFTASRIAEDNARVVGEIESVAERAIANIGTPRNAEAAGSTLQSGLTRFTERFQNRSNELYEQLDAAIPEGTVVDTSGSVQAIRSALEPFKDNPELASQLGLTRWARMADSMEGGLNWQATRELRSHIGRAVGKIKGALTDVDDAQLKQAYAALTRDLEQTVGQLGPEAQSAWGRANTHYAAGARRIEEALDKTITANSPERAFEAFDQMTRRGAASSDVGRVRRIRSSLSDDEWREVSASVINRLGRATNGAQDATGEAFSPSTFLTNWNKMEPGARNLLLPRGPREELEKLAEVAAQAKAANAERNFSNTGSTLGLVATVLGAGADAGATAAVGGGAYLTSRAMTNVTFLRALNKAARGDVRQMRALANGNGPFVQDANTILRLSAADAAVGGEAANITTQPTAAIAR